MTVVPRLGVEPGSPGFEIPDANHSTTADSFFELWRKSKSFEFCDDADHADHADANGIIIAIFSASKTDKLNIIYAKYVCKWEIKWLQSN